MDCLSLCIRSTGYLKLCHRSCASTEFSQRCKIAGKLRQFGMEFLKGKDVTGVRRWPTCFHGASAACDCVHNMEFYLAIDSPPAECSLRAKSYHLAFTACSVRRLHTCTIHVVRQWYPKGPREVFVQAQSINYCVYTAIIWVTWARQRSSIGVAWDLTALPRRTQFVYTACLS